MENSVKQLLEEEKAVNKKVQAALAQKNELLKTIKTEAEISIHTYKKDMEKDFQKKLAIVSIRTNSIWRVHSLFKDICSLIDSFVCR